MKKIVFSTGAGISAESGITTFRDAGGLWEQYPVMQVASAEGFAADPGLVHRFYNARRHDLAKAAPNEAHKLIAGLQDSFDVRVVTQNVDDLHERAGSRNVLHLHGELMKLRSVIRPEYTETLTPDNLDSSPDTRGRNGDPMRPHIVFFRRSGARNRHGYASVCQRRHLRGYRYEPERVSGSRPHALRAPRHAGILHRSRSGTHPRHAGHTGHGGQSHRGHAHA